MAAAKGVPKSPEKAALIPHIMILLCSFLERCKILPILEPREPPTCRAAPSRPTEAPKKWETTVLNIIKGAISAGNCSPFRTDSITRLVPFLFLSDRMLYAKTKRSPAKGRAKRSWGCFTRNAEASTIPWAKKAEILPTTAPVRIPSRIHFKPFL